jgi:predicted dehydrogenase
MVGYNLRFHPPLAALREAICSGRIGRVVSIRAEVGQYLPDWRPGRDYRGTQSAHQSRGGGLILELSHEIDYPMWMLGDIGSVVAKAGKASDLEIDTDDVAELVVTFAGGAIGSIHLDMVQRRPRRLCRVVGTEGTLEWEASSDSVRFFSAADRTECDLWPGGPCDRNEMYLRELRHFLDCAAGRCQPAVTGEDGRRTLRVALAAAASARTGREEIVCSPTS